MPLQNRVTPFGDIVAIPQRGLFTGNRGIIHDPATRTLLSKRWATKTWLICSCDFKNMRRTPMSSRSWTELFFLDEATALAAGHRPCFLCRRDAAERFCIAWTGGNSSEVPTATTLDEALHCERLQGRRKRIHVLTLAFGQLPTGTMIAAGDTAFVIANGHAFRWTPDGYQVCNRLPFIDGLITPPSTVRALQSGYQPVLHPTIDCI
nr:hypothetical protein [Bradyrhizobium tropiciagri]